MCSIFVFCILGIVAKVNRTCSSINGLLEKIETQKLTFEDNKRALNKEIDDYKGEIASLNHFQEVREEMEEHEVNLTKEVAAQKEAFQA